MRTAISIVAIRNGRILLVRKHRTWILPGGKPEPGESDLDCLQREIKEELPGLEVLNVRYLRQFEGTTPHTGDTLAAKVYFADVGGEASASAEVNAVEWVEYPEDYNLSDITREVIVVLRREGHL